MDILSTIAQSLDQQGLTDAAAFLRRLVIEKSRVCATLGNPDVTAYIVGQLSAAGFTAAAQLAQRVGAAAAGICQVLSTNAALPPMAQSNVPALNPAGGPVPGGPGVPSPGWPTPAPAPGWPAPAPAGACCGSCASGGACSLKHNTAVETCPPAMAPAMPGAPIPMSTDIGRWNCQQVQLDLAPCDIRRITREQKLVSFTGTAAGAIAANSTIDVLFGEIGVSHTLCIEHLLVENVTNGTGVALPISQITLQGERIAQESGGSYVHVWDFAEPERPEYLGITDGRCECKQLCTGVPSQAKARIQFQLPSAIAGGSSLRVTLWGRRSDWTRVVGPCPPCDACDMIELSTAEKAAHTNAMIVTAP
ncbi:hypothetical protein [Nannocystis bainbridge]|uniref:Uncharacterized protein n=1 Tax=Nannocystis bainbridge TaxID=2995303 RepID=A0ABT5E226_9BACT|nr:hypothetical protein [Nannocystis bainbridge]MDC0719924.1 hypothetical protein [Nannocystis bainbridge]